MLLKDIYGKTSFNNVKMKKFPKAQAHYVRRGTKKFRNFWGHFVLSGTLCAPYITDQPLYKIRKFVNLSPILE